MSFFDRMVVGVLPMIPKPVVGVFSRPYIAGVTRDSALAKVRELNAAGMHASLDVLGENISSLEQAERPREAYRLLLDDLRSSGVDSNISIKLSQLGLLLDRETCYAAIRTLVDKARGQGTFVRLDMEDSHCTDATLEIYRRLRSEFENVGVVLQCMLRRTRRDLEELLPLRPNIRLCKGIYVEPLRIAWRDRELINRNYMDLLELLFEAKCYVGIATHDEKLVWEAYRMIRRFGLKREEYEFQMLLGVDEELRRIILNDGHRLRVYVPFGEQWYAYSVRRLRENPRLAGAIARQVLSFDRKSRG